VRQNTAEIDETEEEEKVHTVVLTAFGWALYNELKEHVSDFHGDTGEKLRFVRATPEDLCANTIAQEVLIKLCSHYT